jgi:hypothetical protein
MKEEEVYGACCKDRREVRAGFWWEEPEGTVVGE